MSPFTTRHTRGHFLPAVVLFCIIYEGLATGATPPDRVAVIPFVNITGNTADDWIGIGIAETITAELERLTSQT
ncbi:MAG: hypothetical protein VX262_01365, partial [Acidobacteriota bacterium]|nr:hypothetical protein [Acidobacteriota bacterium]